MRTKILSLHCLVWPLLLAVAGISCDPLSAAVDPQPAQQIHPRLEAGRLLIADRSLQDPNFTETVILLLRVTDTGTIGVVINDLTATRVADIFPQIEALAANQGLARYGGPVARSSALVLVRSAVDWVDSEKIFDDVWLAAGETALRRAVEDDAASFRVYLGYSGWAPGQLEAEVARHDWKILPADASLIFDRPAAEIWPELIRRGRTLLVRHPMPRPRRPRANAR